MVPYDELSESRRNLDRDVVEDGVVRSVRETDLLEPDISVDTVLGQCVGAVGTRHFSSAPICQPARHSWITGVYPHTHGIWENHGGWVPAGTPILMHELAASGIAAARISAEGRGENEPIADNTSEQGRARNRRVEVSLSRTTGG